MATTSSVLVIGHPQPESMDIGAAMVHDFSAAEDVVRAKSPDVVVFSTKKRREFSEFCSFLREHSPSSLWIVVGDSIKPGELIELANGSSLFEIVTSYEDGTLIEKLKLALEHAGERAQSQKLAELVADQSQHLMRLKQDLESRIERRHKALRKSKQTLDATKSRLEAFHRALIGVHRAKTVLHMEKALTESMNPLFPGIAAHIRFHQQSSITTAQGGSTLVIEIPLKRDSPKGEVVFTMTNRHQFTPDETDFLQELAEALGLALSRLNALDLAETVKAQWQATFDSIPHSLCLCTGTYEIVKLNLAFQQACPQFGFRELIGKNCFKIFLGQDFTPPATLPFRVSRGGPAGLEHYEVSGDDMGLTHDGHAVRLVMLREITNEVRYERRILESSKLAELGTIGSSIAHELNNPLGGMLSFLQLILMDVKSGHPLYDDIKSMESATLRCRDIVQNLLSFARKQDLGSFSECDLWEIVEKSVKLIELQSKSKGIAIEVKRSGEAKVSGSENALSQAFCNLLQNSIDAISEKLAVDPLFPGRIQIELRRENEGLQLRIADNGMGIQPELQTRIFNPLFTTKDPGLYSGMGLTSAFGIINEHHGSLEILSQTGSGTTAIVSLPSARKTNF